MSHVWFLFLKKAYLVSPTWKILLMRAVLIIFSRFFLYIDKNAFHSMDMQWVGKMKWSSLFYSTAMCLKVISTKHKSSYASSVFCIVQTKRRIEGKACEKVCLAWGRLWGGRINWVSERQQRRRWGKIVQHCSRREDKKQWMRITRNYSLAGL